MKKIAVYINRNLKPDEAILYTKNSSSYENAKYRIHFGNKNTTVHLIICNQKDDREYMEISENNSKLLKIPFDIIGIYIAINKKNKQITLLPLIGIFIRNRKNYNNISNLQRKVVEHYLTQAKNLNYYAFAFSAEDINWVKKIIKGYVLNDKNEITKRSLPFPNVMYDQNCSRTYEKKPFVKKALNKLHKIIPYYFNPGYLNKWEIYEYINNHEAVRNYHPPTQLLVNVKQVAIDVDKYGTVYIKPINGSQGRGIITVVKKNNYYEYKYQGKTLMKGQCKNREKLEKVITNFIKNRKYIIQKGLALVKYKGSSMDVRVLMQKNDKGNWIRTKMFARISKPGLNIANLSLGGEAKTVDEALSENFSQSQLASIKKKILLASRSIPIALEEQSVKHFGELGLDLGITEKGEIWLIEINSKPWKAIETVTGTAELVEKSFRRPIEYAGYLVNYGIKKEV